MSVIGKINEVREGWRHPHLHVSGILVTKMNARVRGHNHLLSEMTAHNVLGKLIIGVIPSNEAVSYAHRQHQSIFAYDAKAPASIAYAQVVSSLVRMMSKDGA
jgi:cellulose biosynthesis protein BcsQ